MADIFAPRFSPYNYLAMRPALRRSLGFVKVGSSYVRKPVARRRRAVVRGYPRGTRGELKSIDTTVSQVADSTGAVTLLNGVARGDDISDRIGRQITLKSAEIRVINQVTSGTGIDQSQRFLIVLDRQVNAVAPAITDVLVSTATTSLTNLDNRNRFVILADRVIQLNSSGESGSSKITTMRLSLKNTKVQFNSGDAATVADITTNGLFLISVGSVAAGATAGTMIGRIRVRYTDN